MMFDQLWPVTEECLLKEAGSFGEMLGRLRSRVSGALIGDSQWAAILDRGRELPVTLAAFPFGFELPLHETAPRADFGVAARGGGLTAAHYQDKARQGEGGKSITAVARLLDAMDTRDAPIRRIADRKLLLEYDVVAGGHGAQPDPGIFLYPAPDVLIGDASAERARDMEIVVQTLGAACGAGAENAELEQIRQVYMAMRPNMSLRAIGMFPGRGKGKGFRIAVTGFGGAREIADFLKHAGWSGDCAGAASILSPFEQTEALGYAAVHLDVNTGGLGPAIGISIYARQGEWTRDVRQWKPLLDRVKEDPLVVQDKLDALADSSCAVETLFGSGTLFTLLRGIHHIKFTLNEGRTSHIKAYVFYLLIALRGGASSG